MTPRDLLEQLNQLDEHSRIEAKAAGEAGNSVLETMFAFTNELDTGALGGLEAHPVADPQFGNLPGLSGNPVVQSGKSRPQSGNLVPRLEFPLEVPERLKNDLEALKQPVPQPELEELVLRSCQWQASSAGELARLIRRKRNYVQDRLLTPMLKAGRLELTIPDQPNHPQQQYRAAVPMENRR